MTEKNLGKGWRLKPLAQGAVTATMVGLTGCGRYFYEVLELNIGGSDRDAAADARIDAGTIVGSPRFPEDAGAAGASAGAAVEDAALAGGSSLPGPECTSFGAFQPPVLLEGLEQFRLFSPSVSDDQLTLVYAAGVPASVYVATRPTEAARFSAGTLLPQVNSSGSDVTPHLSFDALSLVFASDRAGRPGLRDLMWTTRATVNSDFSPPTFLDEVNSLSNADKLGRLSSDQLTLQFTSNRPGGLGGDDLWRAVRRTQAEAFSMPTPMLELNSVNEDSGAVLSESGLEVFLASDRGSPLGTKDLFVATRAAPEVPFSTPVPVDALNSLGWDGDPALSRTGEVIYFSSDRLGSNQIWTSTRSCTE